jgi:hypothetical protein
MNFRGLFQNKQIRSVLIGVGIFVALYLISSLFVIGGIPVFLAINDITAPVAGLSAAVLFALASQRKTDTVSRRLWLGMALGYLLWGIADLYWGVSEVIFKSDVPFPSWADLLFVVAYIPMISVLHTRLVSLRFNPNRRQRILMGISGTLLAAIVLVLVIWPIVQDWGNESAVEGVLNILYPMLDLVLAFYAGSILIRLRDARYANSWQMILTGLLLMTVSDLLFSYSSSQGLYLHDENINAVTILVDVTYALAYIFSLLGIYLYIKLREAKEAYVMRLEMAPLVRFYALVYTNRENQIISYSSNFHRLVNASPDANYRGVKLEEALELSEQDSKALTSALTAQDIISNVALTIMTAESQSRQVWLTALVHKDDSGAYNGADIALRANLNVPEYLLLPQGQEMSGVLRYLLAHAGSLSKDESPSLRAYFVEVIRLLSSLLHQFGGPTFQNALFSELSLTAMRSSFNVTFTNQVITVPEECEGQDLAQMLLPLLHAARIFTAGIVGEEVVQTEIGELELQLDQGILKDLEKYGMRV